MKQIEATQATPFYSVSYQWDRVPGTLYSFNRYFEVTGDEQKRTMQGTGDEALAKQCADWLVKQKGIVYAQVSKTVDCYNHERIYETKAESR